MTLIIKILSIIGIVLLFLLAIILLIIVFPRKFRVEYTKSENITVKMNLLFFRIRLYPIPDFVQKIKDRKSGKEADVKDEKAEEDSQSPQEEKKKTPFDDIQLSFQLIEQILSAAKGIIKKVLKAIKFSDISFTLPLHSKDAFETQKLYGNVTTAFYTFNTYRQRYVQLYYKRPIFVADFADQHKDSTYFYMQITASPLLLVFAGVFAFKQYKFIIKNNNKTADATK